MGKYWFMTAVEDWPEVTEHIRAKDGSKRIPARSMSIQELSESPFNVYVHRQRKGDLVIIPSRRLDHPRSVHPPANSLSSFSQTIHRGVTASLCWDRMTLQGLEMFIYHDRIFKQRYDDRGPISHFLTPLSVCAKIRYRPHRILCDIVLGLYEELFDLKRSQPNDQSSLLAKSGILERTFDLLDEVVKSSYCSQDELLPITELPSPPPPCSFCGGELFRTVFRCTDSCVRDDASGGSVDCKILICDHCFIDGRTCRCGSMAPYRLQPLEELLNIRTNVVNLLGLSDERGPAWS